MLRGQEIRVAFAHAKLLAVLSAQQSEDAIEDVASKAEHLGYSDYLQGEHAVPAMFQGEADLSSAWEYGQDAALNRELVEQSQGTRAEWDALSPEEQFAEWDGFHDACALGVADDLYFYQVMMSMHLVGYVGH